MLRSLEMWTVLCFFLITIAGISYGTEVHQAAVLTETELAVKLDAIEPSDEVTVNNRETKELETDTVKPNSEIISTNDNVIIINKDPETFLTKIGKRHRVTITQYSFWTTETCYVVTPNGDEVNLKNIQIPGLSEINDFNVACGVNIDVVSEDLVGEWLLITRGTRFSIDVVERRLPFTIRIEETVNALPSEIEVLEGKDFYIRLEYPTSYYETCKLINPNGDHETAEKDTRYTSSCGFIIKNASSADQGIWEINYGIKTFYRALVNVTVNDVEKTSEDNSAVAWSLDRSVEQFVGPENAVYCKVVDPNENTVYDGFGRCHISLQRVTREHAGTWTLFVGLPGRVLAVESKIEITVTEAAPKPVVSTSVVSNKPHVTLTCSVTSEKEVISCKFRDPAGRILLANPGVGEGRYAYHGNGTSYESGLYRHECGIQITDPVVADLGLWRCAMETENEWYYGFLSALCPWAMRDPEVAAAVESEPTLTASSELVSGLIEESITMSCSVQSAIRYCYFRARNGTVFTVSPGESTSMLTYAGAGFDAGECSVRFWSLNVSDSGRWSCHVGFLNSTEPEQRASFDVQIQDPLVVEQRADVSALIVRGRVHDNRALDYCRFVRIDGLGFTTDNLPDRYHSNSLLSVGVCEIRIPNPSILEMHPWTVAVRVRGQTVELSRQTIHTLQLPDEHEDENVPGEHGPEGDHGPDDEHIIVTYRFPTIWVMVIMMGICLMLIGILLTPKKNREWASTRASAIRNSFTKKAASGANIPERTTPLPA